MKNIFKKIFPEERYPVEICDINYCSGIYYIHYKFVMMSHIKKISLAEFLNDDDLIRGLDPLEIRALTQLESYSSCKPSLEIDFERFNPATKTYEIILKHKFDQNYQCQIDLNTIVHNKKLNKLSHEDAFKLGYLYALKANGAIKNE